MSEKTIQFYAQQALDVQMACNMSGIVISFLEAVRFLRTLPESTGTAWVNQHPIVQLYADKITDLARVRDMTAYSRAYDDCTRLAAASAPVVEVA